MRTQQIMLRISKDEEKELKKAAKKSQLTVSAFCREVILTQLHMNTSDKIQNFSKNNEKDTLK